jgi:hypothetical protein
MTRRDGGQFPGDHARNVLRWDVIILDQGGKDGATSPTTPSVIVRGAGCGCPPSHRREKRTSA